jgi:hypothetical protein
MKKGEKELRMYGFVPYQLSGIQAGIQFGHSVVEYSLKYGETEMYKEWAKYWKTFIILNGGTSNSGDKSYYDYPNFRGNMETIADTLEDIGNVKFAKFYEPDLNYMLSGICLIVDERVFDYEKYPDIPYPKKPWLNKLDSNPDYEPTEQEEISYKWLVDERFSRQSDVLGSKTNAQLREFLRSYRLAQN